MSQMLTASCKRGQHRLCQLRTFNGYPCRCSCHAKSPDAPALLNPLTASQIRILTQLRDGHSNQSISGALGYRPQTVKNKITRLFRQFGVHNRTQAVMHALRRAWIPLA